VLITVAVNGQVHQSQAVPVETYFRNRGLLENYELTAGIPETLPGLLQNLARFVPFQN
jgi:hypothetical protein